MKKIAILFHGRLRDNEKRKVICDKVFEDLNNFFKEYEMTFYGHFWESDETLYDYYLNYCDKSKMIVEDNKKYETHINTIKNNIIQRNINKIKQEDGSSWHVKNMFAQISNVISIGKVCDLVKNDNPEQYDYFVVYRPDEIQVIETTIPESIEKNTFYLNKHSNYWQGDTHFILHIDHLNIFHELFEYIINYDNEFVVYTHKFFHEYFCIIKKFKLELLNISVGENCECYRIINTYPQYEKWRKILKEKYPGLITEDKTNYKLI
jgi:hypothetical protein